MNATRAAYLDAARVAVALSESHDVRDRWDEPTVLPHLRVGALVAHLARSVLQPASYLDTDAVTNTDGIDAVGHYRSFTNLRDPRSEANTSTVERAVAAAAAGHRAVVGAMPRALRSLEARLEAFPEDRVVTTFGDLPMTLDEYLRTRCVELSVHVDDLARSVGRSDHVPEAAIRIAIDVVLDVAADRIGMIDVLRSLTGRTDSDVLRLF